MIMELMTIFLQKLLVLQVKTYSFVLNHDGKIMTKTKKIKHKKFINAYFLKIKNLV